MMKSAWDLNENREQTMDPVDLRVYTSRLLGREPSLVLHGGGNTSVKVTRPDYFGDSTELLFVKGSGWDLSTIERQGLAPVRMDMLLKLAELETLSDTDMVRLQRSAMANPDAPNPSVEAILHAIIPFKFVDHSHSDAVVTLSNSPNGDQRLRDLYGERVVFIPYVMPGFKLAKAVWEHTRSADWTRLEGIVLLHHGVFTFGNTARSSYERMIQLVSEAEDALHHEQADNHIALGQPYEWTDADAQQLAHFRSAASLEAGRPMLARFTGDAAASGFASRNDVQSLSQRGPITPDHVIHTKRVAAILDQSPSEAVESFSKAYNAYFESHAASDQTQLDAAPRWAVWLGKGTISLGFNHKRMQVVQDITRHTVQAIQRAQALGGWEALPANDIFDVEYWELEQAKLKRNTKTPSHQGQIALVTGAASGIGQACVDALLDAGAVVSALDINPLPFNDKRVLNQRCDVTKGDQVQRAIRETIRTFGGLDILVSNAGSFPLDQRIEDIQSTDWEKTLTLNLTSHQQLMTYAFPYLKSGWKPSVVIIGSKNVPAPGPGVSAYSAAKAGLTQFARVAALEWGEHGIRVNTVHPNAVFDTAIWDQQKLERRAAHYGLTVEDYQQRNVLQASVTSSKVGRLVLSLTSDVFECTTGAQVPIDGGNERVI